MSDGATTSAFPPRFLHTTTTTSSSKSSRREDDDAEALTSDRLQYLQAQFAKGCGPVPLVFL
jgi:hypothetical protein